MDWQDVHERQRTRQKEGSSRMCVLSPVASSGLIQTIFSLSLSLLLLPPFLSLCAFHIASPPPPATSALAAIMSFELKHEEAMLSTAPPSAPPSAALYAGAAPTPALDASQEHTHICKHCGSVAHTETAATQSRRWSGSLTRFAVRLLQRCLLACGQHAPPHRECARAAAIVRVRNMPARIHTQGQTAKGARWLGGGFKALV